MYENCLIIQKKILFFGVLLQWQKDEKIPNERLLIKKFKPKVHDQSKFHPKYASHNHLKHEYSLQGEIMLVNMTFLEYKQKPKRKMCRTH